MQRHGWDSSSAYAAGVEFLRTDGDVVVECRFGSASTSKKQG
jgi:hypothetical protein